MLSDLSSKVDTVCPTDEDIMFVLLPGLHFEDRTLFWSLYSGAPIASGGSGGGVAPRCKTFYI